MQVSVDAIIPEFADTRAAFQASAGSLLTVKHSNEDMESDLRVWVSSLNLHGVEFDIVRFKTQATRTLKPTEHEEKKRSHVSFHATAPASHAAHTSAPPEHGALLRHHHQR